MMRVYGMDLEVTLPPTPQSTARYTRLPQNTTPFASVAKTLSYTTTPRVDTMHQVERGENLTQIVRHFLESTGASPTSADVYAGVKQVATSNQMANPHLIYPGQEIDLSVLMQQPEGPSAALATPPTTPLVKEKNLPALAPPAPEEPVDALREMALTKSMAPHAIARPQAAEEESLQLADARGGHPTRDVNALQRLLNGTHIAISRVRELLDTPERKSTIESTSLPWEGVLNGSARISSEYGMRKDPFTGRLAFHDGIDLAAKRGTEIRALRDGEVIFSGWKGGYGNTVIVRHADGLESVYGHTSDNMVAVGDTVSGGDVIAKVGSSGRSTGPHLHLEMRRHGKAVDPMPHLTETPLRVAQNEDGPIPTAPHEH